MRSNIETNGFIKELAEKLSPLYVVGGFVRDSLLGYDSSDVDVAGPLSPKEVTDILKGTDYKVSTTSLKMMTLKISRGESYCEYTTFRTETYTDRSHTPSEVSRTDSIEEDAKRRDFTINAIYADAYSGQIIDPLNGLIDLNNKVLCTAVSPDKVFGEDGLRLMRLCRFAAELGFSADKETLKYARKHADLIDGIAAERIREELDRILKADTAHGIKDGEIVGLNMLTEIGVTERILPEIAAGIGMEQRKDYHKYDVYRHTLEVVRFSPPSLRLAALLHDVGKPYNMNRTGSYHGHENSGEELTKSIMTGLCYPIREIKRTSKLVALHMYNLRNDAKDSTLRQFIATNYDVFDDLMKLKQADYLGGGLAEGVCPVVENMRRVENEMKAEKAPFSIKELSVTGDDLIEMGVPPIKRAEVLNRLLRRCVTSGGCDTREKQLIALKGMID